MTIIERSLDTKAYIEVVKGGNKEKCSSNNVL